MDNISLSDTGQIQININDSEHQSSSTLHILQSTNLTADEIIRAILCILCILPNCFVLILIFTQKNVRVLQYLNANLAFAAILAGISGLLNIGDKKQFEGLWLCPSLSYGRNSILNIVALNVLCISHERVRGLRTSFFNRFELSRMFIFIWGTAVVGAIPTFFTTIFVQHQHSNGETHSRCLRGPLLESDVLGMCYEVIRCMIFHVGLSIYLIFELFNVRSKLKYFYHVPSSSRLDRKKQRKLRRKILRVRFVFVNSIIFIIIWIPFGIAHSFYKNVEDKNKHHHFKDPNFNDLGMEDSRTLYPPIHTAVTSVFLLYILLMPFTLFCVHGNLPKAVGALFGKNCKPNANNTINHIETSFELTERQAPTLDRPSVIVENSNIS